MKIAVIMCVHNGCQTDVFARCLESIESAQLGEECSLRIYLHVDGVVNSYLNRVIAGSNIYKLIRSQNNVGLAAGLNKLISLLEGEDFIFRMDSDDVIMKDRFFKQIQFMLNNRAVDFSGGAIIEFENDEENIQYTRRYPSDYNGVLRSLVKGSPFAHVTVCFRQGFFDVYGMYPTEYPLNEDIAYWFRCLKAGAIGCNIDDVLVRVRMDDAYGRRGIKKAFTEFKVYREIANWRGRGRAYAYLRLLFRFFPKGLLKLIYRNRLRNRFLKA